MTNYQHLLTEFQKDLVRVLALSLKAHKIGRDCLIMRDRERISYVQFIGDNTEPTYLEEWQNAQDADLDRLDELGFIRIKVYDAFGLPTRCTLNETRITAVFDADFDISDAEEDKREISRLAKRWKRATQKIALETKPTVQIGEQVVPVPDEIQTSFSKFRNDYPDPSKTAFIMMSFGNSVVHTEIVNAIRDTLRSFGIVGLRADDKEYHRDLYPNMLTYIYGCQFGIAVFERTKSDVFNPNVAFEVGYMFGIGKEVCLLKDETIAVLPADFIGKLYRPFDPFRVAGTLPKALTTWLSNKGFGSELYKALSEWYEKLKQVSNEYMVFCNGDKTDVKRHIQIIREAQDICEKVAEYDTACPPECLTVHTEADAVALNLDGLISNAKLCFCTLLGSD